MKVLRRCCTKSDPNFVQGNTAGQGASCKMQHIECSNCGYKTKGLSWWYDNSDPTDMDIKARLIEVWDAELKEMNNE